MKALKLLLIGLLAGTSLFAKIWTVANRPGASFPTITAAVASASVLAGDTILVSGSATAYAGFTLGKKLTIIGPGYFLGQNTGLQVDTNAARISSNVTIQGGAQGTTIMGLHFLASLYVDADNVSIMRNRMQVTNTYDYCVYVYAQDSVVIRQNYMTQTATFYHNVTVATAATQIFIQNNFIEYLGGSASYGSIDINGTMTGDISNNIIYGDVDNVSGGFTFNNNIIRSGC